jgi:hypothetical protein
MLPTSEIKQALSRGLVIVMNVKCTIEYDGRASSRASEAWRLIIIKPDGSILIHTNEGYQPLNWQPPGSRVYFNNNEVIAIRTRPREVLRVRVSEVAWVEYAIASEGVFKLSGTHEDVKAWVVRNLGSVTGCREAVLVGTEVEAPPAGVVDVLARGCGKAFVIEVKRGVVDLNAVSQLKRYVDAVRDSIGVLVGQWFTSGARELARSLGFRVVTYE